MLIKGGPAHFQEDLRISVVFLQPILNLMNNARLCFVLFLVKVDFTNTLQSNTNEDSRVKCGMKLLINSQASTGQRLKFVNG